MVKLWFRLVKTLNWDSSALVTRKAGLGDMQGVLVLLNSSNSIVWSSNSSRTVGNPVSQLLDTRNLIVKYRNETNPYNYLWQSFNYPCDTLLPEMKLGWNLASGLERYVSSWKSTKDPAQGEFSLWIIHCGLPQLFTMKGEKIQVRGRSWTGIHLTGYEFRGKRELNPIAGAEFGLNKDEVYYKYTLQKRSVFARYILNPLGVGELFTWVHQTQSWAFSCRSV
ncbi:G-type lectin S-receptor-like serine/threonine-protein kinase At4g27290 [Pyrus x bretschneideri]|uniref:G-type lectin S-receptor-like serine/threonine-protein kinase At4g27290 n=1 Tax=Pyrus x bretschneideri TaxID=225117 RepID=UPI00202F8054|nr:G-type lectin S-receptor-like serine/threonine-protein kinase At4g27290 [Pyrus x bretschneideri]